MPVDSDLIVHLVAAGGLLRVQRTIVVGLSERVVLARDGDGVVALKG